MVRIALIFLFLGGGLCAHASDSATAEVSLTKTESVTFDETSFLAEPGEIVSFDICKPASADIVAAKADQSVIQSKRKPKGVYCKKTRIAAPTEGIKMIHYTVVAR